jgi:uncharacterized membrane protein
MNEKKLMLVITIISIIVFFIIIIYGLTSAPHGTQSGKGDGKPPIPTYILSIASIFIIMAIIPLFYILIHRGLEKNFQETMKVILQSINENTNTEAQPGVVNCSAIILNFLNFQEKQVVKKLIEEKGNVLQSDISRIGNMGKVKTHRAVKDLERKGIIKIEKYGNTNRLYLTEDIKKILRIV